jgi:hypothetical protein
MASNGIQNLINKNSCYRIQIYSFSNGLGVFSFPAFITNFTDSFSSAWSTETVYGKMDPISTFKNTTRAINLGFDIPSDSSGEAISNLNTVNKLIRGLYPVYDEGKYGTALIASPPMFRIKFANLVRNVASPDNGINGTLKSGLLCYIENFVFTPVIDNGFFVVNDNIYPKLITATLDLKILHEHALGNAKNGDKVIPRVNFGLFPHNALGQKPSQKDDTKQNSVTPTTEAPFLSPLLPAPQNDYGTWDTNVGPNVVPPMAPTNEQENAQNDGNTTTVLASGNQ